eukprot:g1317.t1
MASKEGASTAEERKGGKIERKGDIGTIERWLATRDPKEKMAIAEEIKGGENVGIYDFFLSKGTKADWPERGKIRTKVEEKLQDTDRRVDLYRSDPTQRRNVRLGSAKLAYKSGFYGKATLLYTQTILHDCKGFQGTEELVKKALCASTLMTFLGESSLSAFDELKALEQMLLQKKSNGAFSDAASKACLSAGLGVAYMAKGMYARAAYHFLNPTCTIAVEGNFDELVDTKYVAIYAVLCALVSYDRQTLKRKTVENDNFKDFLERSEDTKLLLENFVRSDYTKCMNALKRVGAKVRCDPALAMSWPRLRRLVEDTFMIQYVEPYSRVELSRMSKAFHLDVDALEERIAELIVAKKISARVDSQNKRILAKNVDRRSLTIDKILDNGDAFLSDVQMAMLRLSVRESGLKLTSDSYMTDAHKGGKRGGMGGARYAQF